DWTANGNHIDASGNVVSRDNVNMLPAEFSLGDFTDCTLPVTDVIHGLNSVCKNTTDEVYYVSDQGNSYTWTITGGTQATGTNTNSITVNWGATGMAGKVKVVETAAGCGSGQAEEFAVNIHPLPTSIITGEVSVAENSTENYSVTDNSGYTYDWSVTGGSITSGTDLANITVLWDSEGAGNVSVTATHDECVLAAAAVNKNITINGEIVSAQTGDWDENTTWVGGVIPTTNDNVRIANGHTVTLQADVTINELTIDNGATIENGTYYLYVYGDYTINGQHNIDENNRLRLYGNGANIDGTGTINLSNLGWSIFAFNGNKTIKATADITINGDFLIGDAVSINNLGSVILDDLTAQTSTSTWINGANSVLICGNSLLTTGTLRASGDYNTITYSSTGTENIKDAYNNTYYNLNIAGINAKTLTDNVIIKGNLNISSELDAANYIIELKGNWTNTGIFSENQSTVKFNNSVDQYLTVASGEIFNNMNVNKSGGKLYLNNEVVIAGTLTMTLGNIDVGSHKLTLGNSTTNIGILSYNSGSIIGQFERWVNATGTGYLFPIGTDDYYRGLNIAFNTLTNGSLLVQFIEEEPGNNGLTPLDDNGTDVYNTFSEGYWKLDPDNSLSSNSYDVDVTANGMQTFDILTTTRLLTRANSLVDWTADGTHENGDPVSNLVSRNGISTMGAEFAIADITDCELPVTSSIGGEASVCRNQANVDYWVDEHLGNTYVWTITGGSQSSGTNTHAITVTWGSVGMIGEIKVTETNSCGSKTVASKSVNINPVPLSDISGETTVAQNSANVSYSVTNNADYTYDWTVTGGNIGSGDGTATILVDWGSAGTGSVSVFGTNAGCGVNTSTKQINVTINSEIVSAGSGNWTTLGT
ncbi:MAG: hypothetical protein V1904_12375, partial [Bacteroidota bacterium]